MKQRGSKQKCTGIIAFAKFIALIFPLSVYLVLITAVFPAPNSGFIALGVLGSFVIGLGMVNLAGIIDKMYLGHIVTLILIASGSFLVALSSYIMYSPAIYSEFDETNVSFYFAIWSLLVVSGVYYPFFRHAIFLDLSRNGMSKSNIKKKMEGARNFWWYQSLKESLSYRWVFYTNKLFSIMFPCVCIVQLVLGWWSSVSIGILIAMEILLTLNFTMGLLITATWNQARTDHKRSSIAIIWIFIFPIVAAIGLITYFVKYM